jgi:hypothetical protein
MLNWSPRYFQWLRTGEFEHLVNRLQKRAVAEHHLLAPVVDDRGRVDTRRLQG